MFYDLNVPWRPNDAELPRTLNFLHELGYNVVALSHTISGKLNSDLTCPIPNPLPFASALPPRLQVLRRCTLLMSEPPAATTPRLNQLASQYDILAVRPVDEKTFQQACTTLDCDLISLDASQRLGFILKHRTLSAALQRGIRLELCYAGGISTLKNNNNNDVINNDAAARRNLIANATALIRATRGGRGLVISSEAHRAAACRAPWDVVNLAIVWGLGQERAKEAVANTARAVVVTARLKRSSYRGAVDVVDDGGGGVRGGSEGGGGGGGGDGGGGSGGGGGGSDGKSYDNDEHERKSTTTTNRKRRAVIDATSAGDAAAAAAASQQPSKRELKRQAKRARTESTAQ